MSDAEERARQLYDCLKDAQEKGAWIERQLTIIAQAIRDAEAAARADERKKCLRCEDWRRMDLSNTCPNCDAAAIRARAKKESDNE